jgi:hypothetical protein
VIPSANLFLQWRKYVATTKYNAIGDYHIFSFLCCMCFILCWFCLSSSCVLCTQYCQFLWIVYSWFPHRFPITFLDIWIWNCSNCVYFQFLILLEVSIIIFCPKSNDLKQQIPPPYSSALITLAVIVLSMFMLSFFPRKHFLENNWKWLKHILSTFWYIYLA